MHLKLVIDCHTKDIERLSYFLIKDTYFRLVSRTTYQSVFPSGSELWCGAFVFLRTKDSFIRKRTSELKVTNVGFGRSPVLGLSRLSQLVRSMSALRGIVDACGMCVWTGFQPECNEPVLCYFTSISSTHRLHSFFPANHTVIFGVSPRLPRVTIK